MRNERCRRIHPPEQALDSRATLIDDQLLTKHHRSETRTKASDQAYFHHELGSLALCSGQLEHARTELEAALILHGALANRQGSVAVRRALTLVADRAAAAPPDR
ncbi:hypothetical protein ACFV0X_40785 [Streptomyces mirabilis]|uniref:hypothetical protein n=1 Tax=Streptomyces mirabilis TaxID=68239 RepID=UPI0036C7A686